MGETTVRTRLGKERGDRPRGQRALGLQNGAKEKMATGESSGTPGHFGRLAGGVKEVEMMAQLGRLGVS